MAITITPSRTGMDVGLSDIASILSEQNQVLAQTADAQQKLTNSFSSYLKMLKGEEMDDLQDERRAKQEAKSPTTASGGMRNLIPTKGGIMDYLKTFLKRLVPVALGIVFGDDLLDFLKPKIESLIGREIGDGVFEVIKRAAGGGLLGFLFGGVKGGIFGLVLMALTSEPVRKKIAETINKALGTELDENDWAAWGTGIVGAFAVLWGPGLLKGAITSWFKGPKGTKFKKDFGSKFAGRLIAGGGILLLGEALADQIGNSMGEDAGDFASMAAKGAGYGFMIGGLKGMLFGAIAMLAVEGIKRAVDYMRNKNFEQFDKSMAEADKVLDEYEKTGDVSVLEKGMNQLKAAQVEANRMMTIGQGSGRYEEAVAANEELIKAMGMGRDEVGRLQEKQTLSKAIAGQGLDQALEKAYQIAMDRTGGNATTKDFEMALKSLAVEAMQDTSAEGAKFRSMLASGDKISEAAQYLTQRKISGGMGMEAGGVYPDRIQTMANGATRSTGNTNATVNSGNTSVTTTTNNSPTVLPSGSSQDNSDSKMAKMLATSAPI